MAKFKIDKTDLRILDELQKDSGRPIHKIARPAKISIPSCARRIKRLEQLGIIERYVALLNPRALNVDLDVFVTIRLTTQTQKSMEEFRKIVNTMPDVVECYTLSGNSDFLLHVRTPGVNQFRDWLKQKLITISHMCRAYSSISLERIKYSTALPLAPTEAGLTKTKGAKKRNRSN